MTSDWQLYWIDNGGDYYAGETSYLFKDGLCVWSGTSNDRAEEIVAACVGGENLRVHRIKLEEDLPNSVNPRCCGACHKEFNEKFNPINNWGIMFYMLCTICGNKRCPHANNHEFACTNSNEPGQQGSGYP